MQVRNLAQVTHHLRDDAVLPLTRLHVDKAVQLVGADGLRAEVNGGGLLTSACLGVLQDLPHGRLEGPRVAHQEDAVPNTQQFNELGDLQQEVPIRVVCVAIVYLHDIDEDLFHFVVTSPWHINAREQVGQQAHENAQVVAFDLGDVGVTQGPHQHGLLRQGRVSALEAASDHQHGLDGPHAPVVLLRCRQEVLVQRVQRRELQAQGLGFREALTHEHVLHDELEVWNHDCDGPEQRLQTLGQL
mmetsp:Transcript_30653/g.69683  ORF Transcript_30653/g.69683 Transcript_30653/m.69683 type:complete len:244 (-) Transcript_30653:483-1214(-)